MLLVPGPGYVDLKREPDELPDDQPVCPRHCPTNWCHLVVPLRRSGFCITPIASPPEEVEEELMITVLS